MDRWIVIGALFVTTVVPPSDWLAHHLLWALAWVAALFVEMLALMVVTGEVTFTYRRRR
jgi:hypothetical protein